MNRSFVFPSRAPSPAVVVSIPRDSFFAGGDSSQGHGKASFSSEMYELTEAEKQAGHGPSDDLRLSDFFPACATSSAPPSNRYASPLTVTSLPYLAPSQPSPPVDLSSLHHSLPPSPAMVLQFSKEPDRFTLASAVDVPSPQSRRKKWWIGGGIVGVALVALSAGLGVYLSSGKQSETVRVGSNGLGDVGGLSTTTKTATATVQVVQQGSPSSPALITAPVGNSAVYRSSVGGQVPPPSSAFIRSTIRSPDPSPQPAPPPIASPRPPSPQPLPPAPTPNVAAPPPIAPTPTAKAKRPAPQGPPTPAPGIPVPTLAADGATLTLGIGFGFTAGWGGFGFDGGFIAGLKE